MSDCTELINNCINKFDSEDFEESFELLCKNEQIRKLIIHYCRSKGLSEDAVKDCVKGIIEINYKSSKTLNYNSFKRELEKDISVEKEFVDEGIKKHQDSLSDLLKIAEEKNQNEKDNNRYTLNDFCLILKDFFDIAGEEEITADNKYEFLQKLTTEMGYGSDNRNRLLRVLSHYQNPKTLNIIRKSLNQMLHFSVYAKLVEYIMENPQVKIPQLITDFNKVRNYLSAVILSKDKQDLKQKCTKIGSLSSYDKESRRLLDLFSPKKEFYDLKQSLKEKKLQELFKMYDIHNVPNIVVNFMLLDVLQKHGENGIKMGVLQDELLKNVEIEKLYKNKEIDTNTEQNANKVPENKKNKNKHLFEKRVLLPQLKELEEYGLINIEKDKINNAIYSINAKFLTEEQKNALQYVVPFFCGYYPFSSIGHFIANKLKLKDKFSFEQFNILNTFDDCLLYYLLNAINSKEKINVFYKEKEDNIFSTNNKKGRVAQKDKENLEFTPTEIFVEKDTVLLKVKTSNGKEYYLNSMEKSMNKNENPVFNEIFGFYYNIIQDVINYKKKRLQQDKKDKLSETDIKNHINKNFQDCYNSILDVSVITPIASKLSRLKNVEIPLTNIERRWLRTIMNDKKFDLFVDDKESLFSDLVKDVEPFDLLHFKIFNYEKNCYINFDQIDNITDKNQFRKKLKELDFMIFSLKENDFK